MDLNCYQIFTFIMLSEKLRGEGRCSQDDELNRDNAKSLRQSYRVCFHSKDINDTQLDQLNPQRH